MLPNNVCNNCIWFVHEKDNDYSHEEAVRLGEGFCLVQNLFTDIQPDDAACPDFQEAKN
jgi:hypothetical protein